MENHFFSESALSIMSQPEKWSVVSSWFSPESSPVVQPRHSAWMAENSHAHPHREILMSLTAGGWQGYCGKVYPRHAGSIFFFDSFELHDFYAPVWTLDEDQLWISLLPQHISICMFSFRNGKIDTRRECRRIFTTDELGINENALLLLKSDSGNASPGMLRLHLTSFIGILIGAIIHSGYIDQRREETEGLQHMTIQAIQHHIEATAGNGVTLDSLTQLTGYSKFHFMRLFKQHTGQSIHQYIDQCRWQRATDMRATGSSQKEISYTLGFSCPAAYCHWQRQYKKNNPTSYNPR